MAAVEAGLEESFSGFKWYQFGKCLCQKEVMKNTVVLKKDGNFLPALASHLFSVMHLSMLSRWGGRVVLCVRSDPDSRSDWLLGLFKMAAGVVIRIQDGGA